MYIWTLLELIHLKGKCTVCSLSGEGTTYPSEHLSMHSFSTCLSGVRVVHLVKLHVFTFLVPCNDVRDDDLSSLHPLVV